jgi:hypothetical protein
MASRSQPAPNRLATVLSLIRAFLEPITITLHKPLFTHAVHDAAASVLDPYTTAMPHVTLCDTVAHQLVRVLYGPRDDRAYYKNLFFHVEADMLIRSLRECFGPSGPYPDWLTPAELQFAIRECEPFRVGYRIPLTVGMRRGLPRFANGRPTEYPENEYLYGLQPELMRTRVAPLPAEGFTPPGAIERHSSRIREEGLESAGTLTTSAEYSTETTQALTDAMLLFQQTAHMTVALKNIRAMLTSRCNQVTVESTDAALNRTAFLDSLARRLHAEVLLRRPILVITPTALDHAIQDTFGPDGQAPSALTPADYTALRRTAGHFVPEKPRWTSCRYCNDSTPSPDNPTCSSCHAPVDDQGTNGPLCHCCITAHVHRLQPDDEVALAASPTTVRYQTTQWTLESSLHPMSVDCELRIDKAFRKVLRLILFQEYDLANPGTPAESPMKTQFINDNCKAFRSAISALATHSRRATPATHWTGVQFYRSSLSIDVYSRHLAAPPPALDSTLDGDGPDE